MNRPLLSYASPCNERSLRQYPVAETMTIMTRMAPPSACIAHRIRPKNAFHCEIFTQKFVRMVFVSYLCTALRRECGSGKASQHKQAGAAGGCDSRSQKSCVHVYGHAVSVKYGHAVSVKAAVKSREMSYST